ncbi:TELO2-interacting protein 1 -like protein [Sarcoptes scabiei]|uniref:TELO2-interacting protein 1 -like protein n=1 Tax=Sarcoptes scabiei TaxID=52283 RepID=A0A834V9B7_SARSC|nr:TELO2-interacting protein 1 -like protein [Sarcoptes scabiei]
MDHFHQVSILNESIRILLLKCADCLAQPDPKKLVDLDEILQEKRLNQNDLKHYRHQLFFTVQSVLNQIPDMIKDSKQRFSGQEIYGKCLLVYQRIFNRITIDNRDDFQNLFKMFIFMIEKQSRMDSGIKTNENTLTLMIETTESLIRSCDGNLFITEFENGQLRIQIAMLSSSLISFVISKQYVLLKNSCLDLICCVYLKLIRCDLKDYNFDKISFNPIGCFSKISRFIAFLMPGLLSKIWRLLNVCSNGDHQKLHWNVVEKALKLVHIILRIIFHKHQTFTDDNSIRKESELIEILDENWFNNSITKISQIISNIIVIFVNHSNLKIKETLLDFSTHLILYSCERFQQHSIAYLLNIPLIYFTELGANSNDSIRTKLTSFKEIFKVKLQEDIVLMNLVQKNFFDLLKKIPAAIRNIDDKRRLSTKSDFLRMLKIFHGSLCFLNQNGFTSFIKMQQHRYHLFRTLINIGEFDYEIVDIVEDSNHLIVKNSIFSRIVIGEDCSDLLNCLISNLQLQTSLRFLRDRELLAEYLSILLELASDFEPSVLLITTVILSSLSETNKSDQFNVFFNDLIDLFLKQLNSNEINLIDGLDQMIEDEKQQTLSIDSLMKICSTEDSIDKSRTLNKSNRIKLIQRKQTIQFALIEIGLVLLFRLIKTSKEYERNDFRNYLLQLIQSIGNPHGQISVVAKFCLMYIGKFIENVDSKTIEPIDSKYIVNRMVLDNLDHIYSSFSIELETCVLHRTSSNALKHIYAFDFSTIATIKNSLLTIIELMKEYHQSVQSIQQAQTEYLHRLIGQILNLIKYYSIRSTEIDPKNLQQLLDILLAYSELIDALYCDRFALKNSSIQQIDRSVDQCVSESIEALQRFKNDLRTIDSLSAREDSSDSNPNLSLDQKNETILDSPIIKSRMGDIFHLCPMILSDSNVQIRLNVLRLASIAMKILRNFDDILLPYVHRFWEPLVKQFSLSLDYPMIVKLAFDCIMLSSELCGDFLLQRTRKEILPSLNDFLLEQFDRRLRFFQRNRTIDTMKSIDYYAEQELLESIGQLLVNIKISSKDIHSILSTLMLYLCCKFIPEDLRNCSLKSLKTIANEIDCYSIMFYVHYVDNLFESKNSNEKSCNCSLKMRNSILFVQANSDLFLKPLRNSVLKQLIDHLNDK